MQNLHLYLLRYLHQPCTMGILVERTQAKCYTLEPPQGHTGLIKPGDYDVILIESERLGRLVPRVIVPYMQPDHIEISNGLDFSDTNGNILVGYNGCLSNHALSASMLCVDTYIHTLVTWLKQGDKITLTVNNILNPLL